MKLLDLYNGQGRMAEAHACAERLRARGVTLNAEAWRKLGRAAPP